MRAKSKPKREAVWDNAPYRIRAYHEAGHAVMVLVLDVKLSVCRCFDAFDKNGIGGRVRHVKIREPSSQALVCLAGYAAEGLYRKRPHQIVMMRNGRRCFRDNSDVRAAVKCFTKSPIWDELVRAVWREARRILKFYWKAVRAIAGGLIKYKKLTGRQAKAIFEAAHP